MYLIDILIFCIRFCSFALLLLPLYFDYIKWYYYSKKIIKNVKYGENIRNKLDIYLPDEGKKIKKEVIIFISGGGWILGYKCWSNIMIKKLINEGYICITPDYRNYPQCSISEILHDIRSGIEWISKNIKDYNANMEKLILLGHSAGAHLGAYYYLESILKDKKIIDNFVGISGPYNILEISDFFFKLGFPFLVLDEIFESDYKKYSPYYLLKNKMNFKEENRLILIHGDSDKTVPLESSIKFSNKLKELGMNVKCEIVNGGGHTDCFIEDLLLNDNRWLNKIMSNLNLTLIGEDKNMNPNIIFRFILKLLKCVNPF